MTSRLFVKDSDFASRKYTSVQVDKLTVRFVTRSWVDGQNQTYVPTKMTLRTKERLTGYLEQVTASLAAEGWREVSKLPAGFI